MSRQHIFPQTELRSFELDLIINSSMFIILN